MQPVMIFSSGQFRKYEDEIRNVWVFKNQNSFKLRLVTICAQMLDGVDIAWQRGSTYPKLAKLESLEHNKVLIQIGQFIGQIETEQMGVETFVMHIELLLLKHGLIR